MIWKLKPKEPDRTIMLFTRRGDCKIVKAKLTQSGWIASYFEHSGDSWQLLCADGKLYPGSYVSMKWMPHQGWTGNETLPALPKLE